MALIIRDVRSPVRQRTGCALTSALLRAGFPVIWLAGQLHCRVGMSDRVAPTITLPGIDHGLLAHVGGDRRLLADVIELFLEQLLDRLRTIRTALPCAS